MKGHIMEEQTESIVKTCRGINMKLGQDTDPFVSLKVGDLAHPSIEGYLISQELIPSLIKALQLWESLSDMEDTPPYELTFKSDGGVIQVKL